ncbi:MAG: endonuclease/exonuclease/phosphatase family protein, partial [Nitrospinales bacterium]
MFNSIRPWTLISLILFHSWSLFRIGALLILESVLAIVDCIRGLIDRQDIGKELKFVPTRVAIGILLRELIVLGAKMDVTRGLPIVHLNLIGYDEQAHRRGPSSNFAHWTLKGIDDAIKRIYSTAKRSSNRDYDLWVYSDHGQEKTIPYPDENGKSVHEAIAEVFLHLGTVQKAHPKDKRGAQLERSKWLGKSILNWLFDAENDLTNHADPDKVVVTAMGSIGHVYSPGTLYEQERDRVARLLVEEANIPLVMVPTQPGSAKAWTPSGTLNLPDDGIKILGPDHPFLEEATQDLMDLCHHPDAGDFIISGWRLGKTSISYPLENGSHTGPGPEETRAFALLPATTPVPHKENGYLRPLDLRQGVQQVLGQQVWKRNHRIQQSAKTGEVFLRIMTYNVHSCIGMDGKLSPDRIARVIAQYNPDIVALQELDVGRQRTGEVDQAHMIANNLEMEFHFHPALQLEEELYGDAILSRYPMSLKRAGPLPSLPHRPKLEKRGALWVTIDIEGREIQLFNTHLGLRKKERMLQAEALLGSQWLAHPDCRGPVVLCGDFNALPNSNICKRICENLKDAQTTLHNHRPQRTWFGHYPVGRIDHVFVS